MTGTLRLMWTVLGVAGILICLTIGFVSPYVMTLGGLLVVLGWAGESYKRL